MTVLSTSNILSYLQCPKRLWLEVHQPGLRVDSSAATASFATGHAVGDIARKIYDPEGTGLFLDIKTLGLKGLIAATSAALSSRETIFEAGFQANNTLALADILIPVDDIFGSSWRMVEVKSSTGVKEYHVKDLAVQTAIATQAGIRLSDVAVAHVDNTWTYQGNGLYQGLLKEECQTAEVRHYSSDVAHWLAGAHRIASLPSAPEKYTGDQCRKPYECGFLAHCQSGEPKVEHPVAWLPRVQTLALKNHLATQGAKAMEDVPDDLLNDLQRRVKKHTLENTVYFDAEGAKKALAMHPLPAYFLDFETITFAVPIWAGTQPYEQLPFQFSLHYLPAADQELQHTEFLDLTGEDPTRPFAEALVESCGHEGPIFVYNKGFEVARIKDLIRHLRDDAELVKSLAAIKERLVDLKPIAQDNFYHPGQKGSWSIKSLLDTMVPLLSYKDLEGVQDGGSAQRAYLTAVAQLKGGATTPNGIDDQRRQLLNYCKLDTFAMVAIRERLLHVNTHDIKTT